MNDKICGICRTREAERKGSHVLTHALTKHAFNERGTLKRNKELRFSLSTSNETNVYVGREVLPNNIEEVLGRSLTEEEMRADDAFVDDYILCSRCETALGALESKAMKGWLDLSIPIMLPEDHTINQLEWDKLSPPFVLSQLLRVHISSKGRFKGFTLPEDLLHSVQTIVNAAISQYSYDLDSIPRDYLITVVRTEQTNADSTPFDPSAYFVLVDSTAGLWVLNLGWLYIVCWRRGASLDSKSKRMYAPLNKLCNHHARGIELHPEYVMNMEAMSVSSKFGNAQAKNIFDESVNQHLGHVSHVFADIFFQMVGKKPATKDVKSFCLHLGNISSENHFAILDQRRLISECITFIKGQGEP